MQRVPLDNLKLDAWPAFGEERGYVQVTSGNYIVLSLNRPMVRELLRGLTAEQRHDLLVAIWGALV